MEVYREMMNLLQELKAKLAENLLDVLLSMITHLWKELGMSAPTTLLSTDQGGQQRKEEGMVPTAAQGQ